MSKVREQKIIRSINKLVSCLILTRVRTNVLELVIFQHRLTSAHNLGHYKSY